MKLDCKETKFSAHAILRMFERQISKNVVIKGIQTGEVIAEYLDDKPYPSLLILSWVGIQPLHIIVAFDEGAKLCVVVTVYIPDPELWENDFKTRRKK